MATNNAINLKSQGIAYYDGAGLFSGIDASTAGYVYTSNGPGAVPSFQAAASGGEILTAKVTLTSLQIKALKATPIQIVAAPGAGKVIMPITAYYYFVYGGTNAFTNGQPIEVVTNNAGTLTSLYELAPASIVDVTTSLKGSSLISFGATITNVPTNMINNPVVVINTGATEITGNAANNNTLEVAVTYYVWTL